MHRAVHLAKLTRPRLYRALRRERLFARLDALREHPIVWICSPPGAGKTTLASSYLEARAQPSLWFQLDGGDADPASFFYYLAEAAERFGPDEPLPLLAPEYLADLAGFTRRFFRALWARLPAGTIVVLDNYHEVPAASVLHQVLRDGLSQLPAGVSVLVTSRAGPPAELARLQLDRALVMLEQDALRLTSAEAREIARLEAAGPGDGHASDGHASAGRAGDGRASDGAPASAVDALWAQCDGWAAGLVLLLEHARTRPAVAAATAPASPEALFRYFASEILAHAAPETRHLLLRTAFLPQFTVPMAEAISGDLDTGQRLEELYRLRWFIERRDDPEPTYRCHALFREFLLARAHEQLDPAERRLLERRSARLLEVAGAPEDAFALHRDTEDWAAASRMIRQVAPDWLDQGRWQTVKGWIGALPPAVLRDDADLLYWLGACELSLRPGPARAALEAAWAGYEARVDRPGQIAAVAAIIETYYFEWSDFAPLDRWIDVLDALLAGDPAFGSPADELRARSSLLAAALYRRPQHPRLAREPARVLALTEAGVPLARQFTAGTILLNYHCFVGDLESAHRVAARLQPRLSEASVPPVHQVWWRIACAYLRMLGADHEGAAGALDEAARIAADAGLAFIEPAVLTQRVLVALSFGDLERAQTLLARLDACVDPTRRMDVALSHLAQAWLAQQQGRLADAARHGERAVAVSFETGAITVQTYCLTARAQWLAEAGRPAEALAAARGVRLRAAAVGSRMLEFHLLLVEAYAALRAGDDAAGHALLREALACGRAQGYRNTLRWLPGMMSWLLARALDVGIEPEYAATLIRARGLAPDSPDTEGWPWPVRIHVLGPFWVELQGEPLRPNGKSPSRPLELLQAIVAAGGREVAAAQLAARLWPDAEGDAADNALDITLHRLRKLLRCDRAVTLAQGRISLDPTLVWVDAWAFERLVERLEAAGEAAQQAGGPGALERLLRLYRGHFLEREGDAAWMLGARERLRSKFVRQVLALAAAHEQAGRWELAARAYQRGLEIDTLAEPLYRRLIVCQDRLGHRAEAIETYRRCRQLLSVVLGVQPCAETRAVYEAAARHG